MAFGAIAQLGERYNGIVEVRGSIPLGSTKHPGYLDYPYILDFANFDILETEGL